MIERARTMFQSFGRHAPEAPAKPAPLRWPDLSRVLWLVLGFKALYMGLLCAALWWCPNWDEHALDIHWHGKVPLVFSSHFRTWDSAHYLRLIEEGYHKDIRSCAFFPLWPLSVRAFTYITGLPPIFAATLLANLFSAAGWMVFYITAQRRFGAPAAKIALICLIAFPGSLFYQFMYSESLFFLLLMLLWLGMERGQLVISTPAAFLLPLARGVGVFCVLPLAWEWLIALFHRPTGACPPSAKPDVEALEINRKTALWQKFALLTCPPLGLGLYFFLMWIWTGNALEGIQAQKYWGVHSIWNLVDVPKFLIGLASPTEWHWFTGSFLDRAAFMFLVYSIPLIWRLGKDMLFWTYALGIIPAMSGTFTSFTRFECVAFPLFLGLGVAFQDKRRRVPLAALLTVFAVLHVILVWRQVNFRWAG